MVILDLGVSGLGNMRTPMVTSTSDVRVMHRTTIPSGTRPPIQVPRLGHFLGTMEVVVGHMGGPGKLVVGLSDK